MSSSSSTAGASSRPARTPSYSRAEGCTRAWSPPSFRPSRLAERRSRDDSASGGDVHVSSPRPRSAQPRDSLRRERDERVAAERVVDDALHVLDLAFRGGLETEREGGGGVRRAHETPAAAGEKHARAVDVDGLEARLPLAGELVDHPELFAVGTERLQLGCGVQVRHGVEQRRDRRLMARRDIRDLARGQDAVVHTVIALGEEDVAADLTAEQDAIVTHLPLEVPMPRLPPPP